MLAVSAMQGHFPDPDPQILFYDNYVVRLGTVDSITNDRTTHSYYLYAQIWWGSAFRTHKVEDNNE